MRLPLSRIMSEQEDKADLLERVFEHYGIAWPNGWGQKSIRCPVHDESIASCTVNTIDGLWFCFACSASGDGFNLIMIKEGMEYKDAVSFAKEFLDGSSNGLLSGSRRKSSRRVSRGQGDKPARSVYRPSWVRE